MSLIRPIIVAMGVAALALTTSCSSSSPSGSSVNTEQGDSASISVPFSRSDLVTGHPFQMQGDRFAVSWRDGGRFYCGVVDIIDGSVRTIDVYPAAQRPAVVGEPSVVYAAFGDGVEGPLIHRIYDFAGNELHTRLKTTWLRPTPSGRYLVASSDLLLPSSFGVFDAQLNPLDQPSEPLVDSRSWDAIPISDTMCVVRNGRTVKQVRLPDMLVQRSREVPISSGFGILGLYCNASGTICAVTNYSDVTVIDMTDGGTFEFRGGPFSSLLISPTGDFVYVLLDRGDGLLKVSQYRQDQQLPESILEVDLGSREAGFIRSHFDTAYSTDSYIAVNYTVFQSLAGQNGALLKSLLIARPFWRHSEITFIDGPSWPADQSGSRIHSLEFIEENRFRIREH